jgi:hypothetical protein
MPLPRTLCRFPLQAAAMRSLPRSGLVQCPLCERSCSSGRFLCRFWLDLSHSCSIRVSSEPSQLRVPRTELGPLLYSGEPWSNLLLPRSTPSIPVGPFSSPCACTWRASYDPIRSVDSCQNGHHLQSPVPAALWGNTLRRARPQGASEASELKGQIRAPAAVDATNNTSWGLNPVRRRRNLC